MSELFAQSRRADIDRGLVAAFGKGRRRPPTGRRILRRRGVSSDGRRRGLCVAGGRPGRPCPRPGELVRLHGQAAQAGLAPAVRYANPADGIAIKDFIVPSAPTDSNAPGAARLAPIARLVKRLHVLPAAPPPVDYMAGMDVLIARFHASRALHPTATAELFAGYDRLRAAYRSDPADLVFAHKDLNRRNILDDGSRLWLIDWEAAFRADRYIDLAALTNAFTVGPDEGAEVLAAYFDAAPGALSLARLFLMRQVNHIFYALVILAGAAAERPAEGGGRARSGRPAVRRHPPGPGARRFRPGELGGTDRLRQEPAGACTGEHALAGVRGGDRTRRNELRQQRGEGDPTHSFSRSIMRTAAPLSPKLLQPDLDHTEQVHGVDRRPTRTRR